MHQDREHERYQRFWEQLAQIEHRHHDLRLQVAPAAAIPGSDVAPAYAYEADHLLCAADGDDLEWAVTHIRQRLPGRSEEPSHRRPGVVKIPVTDVDIPTEVDALNQMFRSDDRGRAGRAAVSPNHVVSIAPAVNFCPADEPKPVSPATKPCPVRTAGGGEGVRVLVVDTGLAEGASQTHAWLEGVTIGGPYQTTVDPDDVHQLIKQYAGHGTFVAGVLRCAAPGTEVTVAGLLPLAGAELEFEFGELLLAAAEEHGWPPIISLSAGGTSHRNQDLLGLRPFLDRLAETDTLLVAAAGNDGNNDNLFFPAASAPDHPGIISVGALRRDQRGRACFSNYGQSVTVFAAGEHHLNAFLTGHYAYQHQPVATCRYHGPALYGGCTCTTDPPYGTLVHFTGLARWSGTSFATPLVAGMIASYLAAHPELANAREAARELLAKQQEMLTDEDGEVLPVLRIPEA